MNQVESDKSIEELQKRKAELDSRFTICSSKLKSRISHINDEMPKDIP